MSVLKALARSIWYAHHAQRARVAQPVVSARIAALGNMLPPVVPLRALIAHLESILSRQACQTASNAKSANTHHPLAALRVPRVLLEHSLIKS